MDAHLSSECRICIQTFRIWSAAFEVAQREREYEPPEDIVRLVKDAYALRQRTPFLAQLAKMAEVVFDSFRAPLPAGIRGVGGIPRHLLHHAGEFQIDLRLEHEDRTHSSLTGQIMHASADSRLTAGAGIILVKEPDTPIAQTIANSLGEFRVEFQHGDRLTLYADIGGMTLIGVQLPGSQRRPPT
jgi:hypothetical protein